MTKTDQMKSALAMWLIFRGFDINAERLAKKIIKKERKQDD